MNIDLEILLKQLKEYGLRITKPRIQMLNILFQDNTHKHITAEAFHVDLLQRGINLSLATVYNTLHVLSDLGVLRRIRTCNYILFDTNVSNHGHLINEKTGEVTDIDYNDIELPIQSLAKKFNALVEDINFVITIQQNNN